MAYFRFFKMAASAILDFRNFKFLTVGTLKRVELRLRAKFCRNRSNRGWDMAIFQFFKMAAFRHLGFLKVGNFNFAPAGRLNVRHRTKFREDMLNRSGDNLFILPRDAMLARICCRRVCPSLRLSHHAICRYCTKTAKHNALYRMALFPMKLSDPNYSKAPHSPYFVSPLVSSIVVGRVRLQIW